MKYGGKNYNNNAYINGATTRFDLKKKQNF